MKRAARPGPASHEAERAQLGIQSKSGQVRGTGGFATQTKSEITVVACGFPQHAFNNNTRNLIYSHPGIQNKMPNLQVPGSQNQELLNQRKRQAFPHFCKCTCALPKMWTAQVDEKRLNHPQDPNNQK